MKTHPLIPASQLFKLLTALGKDDFVLLDTSRVTSEDHHSLLFTQPVSRLTLRTHESVHDFLSAAQNWLDKGFFLAGWLAYELGYLLEPALSEKLNFADNHLLADLGVFQKPLDYNHIDLEKNSSKWTGEDCKKSSSQDNYTITNLHLNTEKSEYLEALDKIQQYIAAGDTYQVNYTLKLLFDFAGSPISLYQSLRRNQSVSYGAYIQHGEKRILSFSPELFFRKSGNTCTVRPMKGTMKRGRTPEEDQKNKNFLQTDSKNRSENVMIVDLLRNDLGRLSEPGSVNVSSLFDVETYETLHQMTSTITGKMPDSLGLLDLFKALFPCGSVTGAPKIRTMEIIRELEKERRGVYTGAIGYLSPEGDAVFNVPIRTVILEKGKGEMGIGSGIVHDSEAEKEWRECKLKADFLTRPQPAFHLIETILWQAESGYWLLQEHFDRLKDSARYFNFSFAPENLQKELEVHARQFARNGQSQRVRVLLSKEGELTIHATPCDEPRPLDKKACSQLPRVTFSSHQTNSDNPLLYHKTTQRQLYDTEREKAVSKGFYEVLFSNEKGEVTEGAISTLFIRKENVFYTPPLTCGLLPGVFRSHFMGNRQEYPVQEKILYPEDLSKADAIYVANSVRGIVQVTL